MMVYRESLSDGVRIALGQGVTCMSSSVACMRSVKFQDEVTAVGLDRGLAFIHHG
jgi:hypothetical protein